MTEPYHQDESVTLYHGDCIDVMRSLPDASIDAIVTDPPYGLEFMGRRWDAPWEQPDVNADAGFHGGGISATKNLPSFTGTTNPKCRVCKGTRRGRRDGTAKVAVCLCEDGGVFPNTRAVEMRAFQGWCESWAIECLRVLKPGGHLLAFGGSRTWHRLACAVEDAGFEIRDSIAWLYGSGFSKGGLIGNKAGLTWCDCGPNALPYNHAHNTDLPRVRQDVHPPAVARSEGQDAVLLAPVQRGSEGSGVGEARPQGSGGVEPGNRSAGGRGDARRSESRLEGRDVHRAGQGVSDGADAGSPASAGERLRGGAPAGHGGDDRASGHATGGSAPHQPGPSGQPTGEPDPLPGPHVALDDGTLRGRPECPRCGGLDPAFRGFSTTLKPAFEPIVVGRKPLTGTVAANVLAHGTGALNIDGCRVDSQVTGHRTNGKANEVYGDLSYTAGERWEGSSKGRWPTNVVLDDTQAAELDRQTGVLTSGGGDKGSGAPRTVYGQKRGKPDVRAADSGGASRFFPTFRYEAKAPTVERPRDGEVAHPTVKPLDLMRWLVRLVTPPGGLVLEPFAGSGTTAEACVIEGFRCIAIEREADYLPLIVQRLTKPIEPVLDFGALA